MSSPAERFVELVDPEDHATTWRLDAGFLNSGFSCIWGDGCQGIHDERRPELMDGCCSVGVVLADDDEAMTITALAATLGADRFERAAERDGPGVLERRGAHWVTRVVDGACVFFNRPGFEGGVGCALHLAGIAAGEPPTEWKPRTCNRVPLRVEETRRGDSTTVTVRAWRRDDWGPGGATMAWWCTEDPDTIRASTPLHERIEPELLDIMGPELLARFRDRLG